MLLMSKLRTSPLNEMSVTAPLVIVMNPAGCAMLLNASGAFLLMSAVTNCSDLFKNSYKPTKHARSGIPYPAFAV